MKDWNTKDKTYKWVSVRWKTERLISDPINPMYVRQSLQVLSLVLYVSLTYIGLIGELEYLKIKTRLIDDKFASVMGEYVFLKR